MANRTKFLGKFNAKTKKPKRVDDFNFKSKPKNKKKRFNKQRDPFDDLIN